MGRREREVFLGEVERLRAHVLWALLEHQVRVIELLAVGAGDESRSRGSGVSLCAESEGEVGCDVGRVVA